MNLELGDKVVLITGGSEGLGRALGQGLVTEGAKVAFCGRTQEKIDATVQALEALGGDVVGLACDVTKVDDLVRFVEAATSRWGRIDAVVNNAGRAATGRLADSDDQIWEDDLALKVMGAVRLTRLALPMLSVRGGAVVNTLAISAKAPGAGSTPTSVSRAAGLALTKALSKELGPQGIRVNAVLIGLIESGQWERMAEKSGTDLNDLYRQMADSGTIPLGRVGRAAEFSDLVCYLLSDRASYVTGTAINLDGGGSPVA
jgi:NAD(P)-dependent dehydrogenase (short-subunit alcohol dehydrogenase family)